MNQTKTKLILNKKAKAKVIPASHSLLNSHLNSNLISIADSDSNSNTYVNSEAENILLRFGLKKTDLRVNLVQLLLNNKKTFSQAEILKALSKKNKSVDRVSIYRNLHQLKIAGIVHEVESNKYAACTHECKKHAHILLFCQTCEKHSEVKDHKKMNRFFDSVKYFNFLSSERALLIKGTCQTCSK